MKRSLMLVCVMGFAVVALAQQYKWVDKDGKVRYGDTPPPGVKATPLKPPPGPAPAPAAAKKDAEKPLSPEAAFRKRQQERQEAEQKAARAGSDDETKRVNCEQSKTALRTLQSGQRVATTNEAGERVYIDDQQRDREIDRVQRAVREWCPR